MRPGAAGALREGSVLALALLLGPALALAAVPASADPAPYAAGSSGGVSPVGAGTTGLVSGRVAVSPVTVRLEASKPAPRAGKPLHVRFTIRNHSTIALAGIQATILSQPSGVTFRPADLQTIRRIAAGREETVSWTVCSGTTGTYVLVATALVDGSVVTSKPLEILIPSMKTC